MSIAGTKKHFINYYGKISGKCCTSKPTPSLQN